MASSWSIEGHKKNGLVGDRELEPNKSVMAAFNEVDVGVDVVMPANS